jgi:AcrR family transcriptional regulator
MRETILAEARRIVSEQGAEQLSVRAIARAVGYSPGALYEYFRDKEAIIHALYFEGTDGLGEQLRQAMDALPAGADPVTVMATLGRAYRTFALEHAELYRLAFSLTRPPRDDEPDDLRGGFGVLMEAVTQGIASGVFNEAPPELLSLTAWSTVHGFVSLELSGHLTGADLPGDPPPSPEEGRIRRDAIYEHVLNTLFSGLVRVDKRPPATDPM